MTALRRWCLCCGGEVRRRDSRLRHVRWWYKLTCGAPVILGPLLNGGRSR